MICGLLWQRARKRRAEAVLRESEKHFRVRADTTPSLIWMCDARGKVTYLNERRVALAGPDPGAGYDDTWTAFVYPDDLNGDSDVACEALRIGASGYLLRSSREDELLQAIPNAMRAISCASPQIRDALEESASSGIQGRGIAQNTSRTQLVILEMLAEGRSMKDIAGILVYWKNKKSIHRNIPSFCGISGVLS